MEGDSFAKANENQKSIANSVIAGHIAPYWQRIVVGDRSSGHPVSILIAFYGLPQHILNSGPEMASNAFLDGEQRQMWQQLVGRPTGPTKPIRIWIKF